MIVELDEHEEQVLFDALHEALRLVHAYRERVADEDSILLAQDLRTICSLLGLEAMVDQSE